MSSCKMVLEKSLWKILARLSASPWKKSLINLVILKKNLDLNVLEKLLKNPCLVVWRSLEKNIKETTSGGPKVLGKKLLNPYLVARILGKYYFKNPSLVFRRFLEKKKWFKNPFSVVSKSFEKIFDKSCNFQKKCWSEDPWKIIKNPHVMVRRSLGKNY